MTRDPWLEVYGDLQDLGPAHRHMRRLLADLLAELDFADALEIGCGAGHNLDLLGERVTGADISAEALRRARAAGWSDLVELDIERGRLERRFDLVFSALVLEHLADDVAALRHMVAMTRRQLVLVTIAGDFERFRRWEDQVGHVRNYAHGELERKLEQAGARIERTIHWGFPFYSPLTRLASNHWRAQPSFGPAARAAARVLHVLYGLNSSRRGDLLIVQATPSSRSSPPGHR